MFKRHDIRVKALQVLYSYYVCRGGIKEVNEKDVKVFVGRYRGLHDETERMLYFFVSLFVELGDYVVYIADLEAQKNLKETIDANKLKKDFFYHPLVVYFRETLAQYLNKHSKTKTLLVDDAEAMQQMYATMLGMESYRAYVQDEIKEGKDYRGLILEVLNDVFLKNAYVEGFVEDSFMNAIEDSGVVLEYLGNVIEKFPRNEIESGAVFETNIEFGERLIVTVIDKGEYLERLILEQILHWQKERMVLLDKVILELALAEILYFEEIPVKVSINEYIELAKSYSTEESKGFVNGVLDGIQKQLDKEGKIKKG